MCSEVIHRDSCEALAKKFKHLVLKHAFQLLVTDEYVCGYLIPICEQKYEGMPVEDYAWRVLKDKPDQDDDFLNSIYRDISKKQKDGSELPSYRVLQITDWHLDLDYREGYSR